MKKQLIGLSLVAGAVLFTACGGSDDSSGADTITGQFIDAAVQGADYECSSGKSGVTNSEGEFTCNTGDTVTFSVAGFNLGTATAQALVTPKTLQTNTDAAVNMAQLLQTLDDDGDPSNGIKLNKESNKYQNLKQEIETLSDAAELANNAYSFNWTDSNFDSLVGGYIGEALVDATTAQNHMNETIEEYETKLEEAQESTPEVSNPTNSEVEIPEGYPTTYEVEVPHEGLELTSIKKTTGWDSQGEPTGWKIYDATSEELTSRAEISTAYNSNGEASKISKTIYNSYDVIVEYTEETINQYGDRIKYVSKDDDNEDGVFDEIETFEHTYTYKYSHGNILTEEVVRTIVGSDSNTTYGYTKEYTYNITGENLLSETDKYGNKTTYTYDENGNLLTEEDWLYQMTLYTYDENGNLVTVKDPDGWFDYVYDSNGNVLEGLNEYGQEVTYTYDSNGNVLTETSGSSRFEDIIEYTYHSNGNLSTRTDCSEYGDKVSTCSIKVYDSSERLLTTNNYRRQY